MCIELTSPIERYKMTDQPCREYPIVHASLTMTLLNLPVMNFWEPGSVNAAEPGAGSAALSSLVDLIRVYSPISLDSPMFGFQR